MANPDQLARLAEGVSTWNMWRRTNPTVKVDLVGAILHETRVPWQAGNLIQIDLEGINLKGANLDRTVIRGGNLRRADLSGASLKYANLRRADLSEANLRAIQLNGTNLTLAKLRDANLTNALFWETILARTDMRDVIGLDTARHGGPSIIDHRTISKSGALPKEFLRGIGLTDELIRHYLKKANAPAYADCFISYSSADQVFVEKLYSDLQAHGVRCWYAPKDLAIGARIRQALDDAIRANERLIIVLSKNSISSAWVEKEVETAFEEERLRHSSVLMPIRIDSQIMNTPTAWAADIRTTRNIGDFSQWENDQVQYTRSLKKLLDALR